MNECKKVINMPTGSVENNFYRLSSFNGIEFINLALTVLVDLGFFYDNKQIKCSDCSFSHSDLNVQSFFELLSEHLKSIKKYLKKCIYQTRHEEFLAPILKPKVNKNVALKEDRPTKYGNLYDRIASFNDFETVIDKAELAKNGFFLLETVNLNANMKKIVCYYCGYECIIFKKSPLNNNYETPFKDHEDKSPNCEIHQNNQNIKSKIEGFQCGNIFLNMNQTNKIEAIKYNFNENNNFDLLKNILNKSTNATCDRPFHPGYVTEHSRVESFREWPINLAQQPIDLARAGFYYYGIKDMVKCFYCNGGLRNWDPIDEPITEHARWFPKCPYIRQLKGPGFIEEVRERYKDMDNGFSDEFDETPEYYDVVNNDENKNNTKIRKRSVSPRTINSRMDLAPIQKIIKLGFSRNLVKKAIENKLADDGKDFEDNIELVKACYKITESSTKFEKQFKEAFHFLISNISMEVTYEQVCVIFKNKFDVIPLQINKINDSNNNSFGTLLFRVKNEDIRKCDQIVAELNGKPFPGIKSMNIIIAKKISQTTNKYEKDESNTEKDNSALKKMKTENETCLMNKSNGDLEDEIEKLKKERACAICCDRQKLIIFLPCAHLAACVECSVAMQTCPICRKKVEATVRTYV